MPRNKNLSEHERYHTPFPTRLRLLLSERGTTQDQIAKELGVKRQTVGRYTDGSALPNYESLALIAKYFNVSIDYLLGASDIQSSDISTQAACVATGLSEKAVTNIQKIKQWKMREIESLSLFLESDVFWDFINALSECYRHYETIADIKQSMDVSAKLDVKDEGMKQYISDINERDLKLQKEKGKGSASYNLYQASIELADYMIEKSEERWGDNGTEE